MKPKVIVIVGPTASGKTKFSIEIAKKENGEIISADSMQIYKSMDIGTAKVSKEEMQGIKHYMLDVVEPSEKYSVAKYKEEAEKCIEEILAKGKTPIIVGGTGLYIDSIIQGIKYLNIKTDFEYREKLEKEDLQELYEKLKKIDIEAANKISSNDKKRIIRAFEIYKATGKTKTEVEKDSREEVKYDFVIYGVNVDREILYERINKRVDVMIENGLIQEVQELLEKYPKIETAMQGLGYKEVKEYMDGKLTKEEMIDKIKMESRRYAKRQVTWFKRNKKITWLNGDMANEEKKEKS